MAVINGDSGNNNLVGTDQVDTINAFEGDDTLEGGAGADTLNGGTGNDTASYSTAPTGVNVYLIPGGTDPNTGHAAGDVFDSIENLRGSAFNDLLFGNQFDNILWGGAGEDTLYGWTSGVNTLHGEGDADTLVGGPGTDIMIGGDGVDPLRFNGDTISYQLSTAGVTVDMMNQANNAGDAAGDSYTGMEDVTGSNFNDIIRGDNGPLNNLDGLAGNDQIFGNNGTDVMIGGPGADTLDGGAGDDIADYETYLFSTGNVTPQTGVTASLLNPAINTLDAAGDVYISIENMAGSLHNDVLHGDNNANVFLAWPGQDQIFGHGGDDTIEGMPGADTMDGGDGVDTASYSSAGTLVIASWGFYTQVGVGVTASLLNPAGNTNDAAGDQYANIENLLGSGFADTLQGDNNSNALFGRGGADTLLGEGGEDALVGGAGADTLNGGAGIDTASYAGASTSVSVALDGSLATFGDAIGDVFISIEKVDGSSFNDVIWGDSGANLLLGEAGNDSLNGRDGDDFIYGGVGADTLVGGAGIDAVSYETAAAGVTASFQNPTVNTGDAAGDAYFDAFEQLVGSNFNDTLTGHQFSATTLFGGLGADTLNGGLANDVLVGGAGADSLVGGGGVDNASYVLASAAVTVFMLAPNLGAGEGAGDSFVDVENLLGSAFSDILGGTDGGNAIVGGAGNDSIYGAGGDDVLTGGAGGDLLDGQGGLDTASYNEAAAGVTAFLGGAQLNTGEAAGDSYASIENLIGSTFADALGGTDVQNAIFGGGGNDLIYGAGGDDVLEGGAGGDALDGQAGYDYASYSQASSGVWALLGGGAFLNQGEAIGDTYTSIEGLLGSNHADFLVGDGGNNTLQGQDGNDWLFGNDGEDYLVGGNGNDILVGGNGNDLLEGGAGDDVAYYREAPTGVRVDFVNRLTNTGQAALDDYSGIENIWASDFDDTLIHSDVGGQVYGYAGNDTLVGNGGDDVFYGGLGRDTITGGSGAEDFFFLRWDGAANEGGDTFTDFTSGVDRFTLSRFWFGFGNIAGPAAALTSASADFVVNGSVSSSRPTLLYNTSSNELRFDPDGTGGTASMLLATLQAGAPLTLNDIWTA
jgi:Ca2+-binding RTX toxin-like protein